MLFLHEVHKVVGAKADDFETAYRTGWMPMLARGTEARLLWYANHAMGSGASYTVVTITAIADGAAWERLALRIQRGDLQGWMRDLDSLRHDVTGKLLLPLPWSPMQAVEVAAVPTDAREHAPTLYMEDTMWPYEGKYPEYVEAAGRVYARSVEHAEPFIRIEAGFQPAFATHVRREVMLMQRILDQGRLLALLTHDIPAGQRGPGTWMHDALALRDQWESRLLRTASWSPLH